MLGSAAEFIKLPRMASLIHRKRVTVSVGMWNQPGCSTSMWNQLESSSSIFQTSWKYPHPCGTTGKFHPSFQTNWTILHPCTMPYLLLSTAAVSKNPKLELISCISSCQLLL